VLVGAERAAFAFIDIQLQQAGARVISHPALKGKVRLFVQVVLCLSPLNACFRFYNNNSTWCNIFLTYGVKRYNIAYGMYFTPLMRPGPYQCDV